jgi:hypothetical protein
MELKYVGERDDDPAQFPIALLLSFNRAREPASMVTIESLEPDSWMAWAVRAEKALIVEMIKLHASAAPLQFQISILRNPDDRLVLILRTIDQIGRRTSSWAINLKRE